MALSFSVGDEQDWRTVGGVVADESRIRAAAGALVRRMRDELWGYFGIPAIDASGGHVMWRATLTPTCGADPNWRVAYRDADAQLRAGVRRRVGAASEAEFERAYAESRRRWERARDRLVTFLCSSNSATLASRSYSRNTALASWERLDVGHRRMPLGGFAINPFTWYFGNGQPSMRFSSERARASQSATLHLLHEIGHRDGCLFPTSSVNGGTCANDDTDTNVIDVDAAVDGHAGIGLRRRYLGDAGLRTYVDSNVAAESTFRPIRPGSEWVEFPNENQLRTGIP
jgi:hypothetical protein